MRKQTGAQPFRITGARRGLTEDVRGRQRRYVISMSVRTVAVVLTAVLWNIERHVAIATLVLGVVLPYVAVVVANAGRENVRSLPSTFIPAPTRPMLGPGGTDGPAEPVPEAAGPDADGPRRERS
ncbi:DUF3099 domain-containing protein [Streptomyces rimosus]|uniref:DUF3099 domain-containing protein n=1 Tax=Streptomyces TaxID=1883 RepID=UPI0004C5E890|nr:MULTISPECIES: DUF3099 domain-containing protein [Streptomyces]KOG52477.1 membrane protein [Streptomyces griseoflavus]KOT87288.1 membrane protein [Streptomyces sp. NRRL F-5755]KWT61227.1 hypothetical protein ADL21_14720 [Streptomyces albus subsp. albus]